MTSGAIKKILLILLILPALACRSTITKPTTNLSMDVYLETATPSPTPQITDTATVTASPEACEVKADALHLRGAPSIEGTVIAWLVKGDQLTILSDPPSGGWIQVTTADNQIGFVNSHYCKSETMRRIK